MPLRPYRIGRRRRFEHAHNTSSMRTTLPKQPDLLRTLVPPCSLAAERLLCGFSFHRVHSVVFVALVPAESRRGAGYEGADQEREEGKQGK